MAGIHAVLCHIFPRCSPNAWRIACCLGIDANQGIFWVVVREVNDDDAISWHDDNNNDGDGDDDETSSYSSSSAAAAAAATTSSCSISSAFDNCCDAQIINKNNWHK